MKAANRWETEAIRESRDRRRARPAVSQERETPDPGGDWRTLREASDETGIPVNTLRKWCRRESVDSHLESDGEVTLRMLEMGSVMLHAKATGRELVRGASQEATGNRQQAEERPQTTADSEQQEESRQATGDSGQAEESPQPTAHSPQAETVPIASAAPSSSPSFSSSPSGGGAERSEVEGVEQVQTEPSGPPPGLAAGLPPEGGEGEPAPGTMIVPVDAWNKMLNQLGNLHEAGQQLAEARERAGKAETEAKFLRERLAEMRENRRQATGNRQQAEERPQATGDRQPAEAALESYQPPATSFGPEPSPVPPAEGRGDAERSDAGRQTSTETTSFWRYVVRGWKGRRR